MELVRDRKQGLFHDVDWWTIGIYMVLLVMGWLSIYGATNSVEQTGILDMSARSGMQLVWIGTALALGCALLMIDDRFYDTFAFAFFIVLVLLLFATIFNPNEIKGSRSWLVLGPLRLQPAEFAKFATALAMAKFMSTYGYSIHKTKDFALTLAIILVPMACIIMQKETGSALVYLSFFLVLYREGMSGSVLFTGIAAVVYFVVGVKFSEVMLWDTPTSVGEFSVLLLIQLFTLAMAYIYGDNKRLTVRLTLAAAAITVVAMIVAEFLFPFDITWVVLAECVVGTIIIMWNGLMSRLKHYLLISLFAIGSLGFLYSVDYVFENVLQPHQRNRINVLLGLVEDPSGDGYNVRQSLIAIGSGGFTGKGFGNGTQNKLDFVPEHDTDFIFCTVGEEGGFLLSSAVLITFLILIMRLITLAERQPHRFGRVYGYSVVSIFLFHVFINVGMVLGLTPVIGIPLPFFSYGGSSLWGFTILLFIFLRIDAARHRNING